jgi:nitrite reductase/ring-hydroxylating ferredoxin subunit
MDTPTNVEWMAVGQAKDWPETGGRQVQIGARRIGVYRWADRWYALKDICPHAGVQLSRGPVEDGKVMCIGHGWLFDLASGEVDGMGGGWSVATYPVRVTEAGEVEVGV